MPAARPRPLPPGFEKIQPCSKPKLGDGNSLATVPSARQTVASQEDMNGFRTAVFAGEELIAKCFGERQAGVVPRQGMDF